MADVGGKERERGRGKMRSSNLNFARAGCAQDERERGKSKFARRSLPYIARI